MNIYIAYMWEAEILFPNVANTTKFHFISNQVTITTELLDACHRAFRHEWEFKNPVTKENFATLTADDKFSLIQGHSTSPIPYVSPEITIMSLRQYSPEPIFGSANLHVINSPIAVMVENNNLIFNPERIEQMIAYNVA